LTVLIKKSAANIENDQSNWLKNDFYIYISID